MAVVSGTLMSEGGVVHVNSTKIRRYSSAFALLLWVLAQLGCATQYPYRDNYYLAPGISIGVPKVRKTICHVFGENPEDTRLAAIELDRPARNVTFHYIPVKDLAKVGLVSSKFIKMHQVRQSHGFWAPIPQEMDKYINQEMVFAWRWCSQMSGGWNWKVQFYDPKSKTHLKDLKRGPRWPMQPQHEGILEQIEQIKKSKKVAKMLIHKERQTFTIQGRNKRRLEILGEHKGRKIRATELPGFDLWQSQYCFSGIDLEKVRKITLVEGHERIKLEVSTKDMATSVK